MRGILRSILAAASLLLVATGPAAQGYPVRPIRIVVPLPAGGYYDMVARTVGQNLSERLGQPFVVENRVGASGLTGTAYAANTPPDGYTLLVNGTGPMVIYSSLYTKIPYDTLRDFAPVVLLSGMPQIVVVHPTFAARSIGELVALARARPGELTYASSGSGATPHLAMEMFAIATGTKLLHVPYNGSAPAVIAMLGGQTTMMFGIASDVIQQVRARKLRALAVGTRKRMSLLPEVPTLEEAGIPGMEFGSWAGLFAPRGTPQVIVARLNAEVNKVLEMPEVREHIAPGGLGDIKGGTAEQFDQFIRSEIAKWAKVVKASGAKAE